MGTDLYCFMPFQDLKKKSSGGGGLSDGGVVSESRDVPSGGSPIYNRPPKGVNWGGCSLFNDEGQQLAIGSTVWNFGSTDVDVEIFIVREDGTEMVLGGGTILPSSVNGGISVGLELEAVGLIWTHDGPYMGLRVVGPAPTGRLLLKTCFMEYDQPQDTR